MVKLWPSSCCPITAFCQLDRAESQRPRDLLVQLVHTGRYPGLFPVWRKYSDLAPTFSPVSLGLHDSHGSSYTTEVRGDTICFHLLCKLTAPANPPTSPVPRPRRPIFLPESHRAPVGSWPWRGLSFLCAVPHPVSSPFTPSCLPSSLFSSSFFGYPTMKSTLLMYTSQRFLLYPHRVVHPSPRSIVEHFCFPRRCPVPVNSHSPILPNPPSPGQTLIFVSLKICLLWTFPLHGII